MSDIAVPEGLFQRYQRLQKYVGWTDADAKRVQLIYPHVEPIIDQLLDDFYAAIEREPQTAKVITGGSAQINRLKQQLRLWLEQLFGGAYDEKYVERRWRVGWRHVEIGLDQAFTDAALSRLRDGMLQALAGNWDGTPENLCDTARSLNRLLDLDLAIIQDAYESEYVRRQRASERQRSEIAFRRLVEVARSLIIILRSDHRIAYFNPFAEQLTGFAAAAVTGKNYDSIFFPEGAELDQEAFHRGLHHPNSTGFETTIRCRDGTHRWLIVNTQTIDDFEGLPALLIIGQDVTNLKEAQARALQAERLAAIGETVTGLAHESRNAFQRSQASLELLTLELADRPTELELVDRVQRALSHLHRLYEEVRDYAAPIKLDRQSCDLASLWRDAWSHLEIQRQDRQVSLEEVLNDVDLECHADWFALGQVFRNIFENALAACPEQGRLEISCRESQVAGLPAVEIAIRDNGPGISEDVREHVFDAFFTTKTKGTGLGLAIARRIVEAHGGTLAIGKPISGAEFLVTVPREPQ